MKRLLILLAFTLPLSAFAAAGAQPSFVPSLIPLTNSKYYLGTTTPSTIGWKSVITDQLCLTGDSCRTTWPSGGSGSLFPFDKQTYGVSTTTTIGLLNGFLSNASSTINANLLINGNSTTTNATTTSLFSGILFSTTHNNSGLGTFGNLLVNASSTLQNFTGLNSTSTNATTTGALSIGTNLVATGGLSTFSNISLTGSSTLQRLTFTNATGSQATTTNLAISSVLSALLKTDGNGSVIPAVLGTDYINSAEQNYKQAVKWSTAAALPTNTYANGSSGVGATLTASSIGLLTVDGNVVAVGDRILVKSESDNTHNGIYTVTSDTALIAYVLTRATDFDLSGDITQGDSVFTISGSANSATTWAVNSASSPTMGSSAITFVQVAGQGSLSAGNGISISGNTISQDFTYSGTYTGSNIFTNILRATSTQATSTNFFSSILTGNRLSIGGTASTTIGTDGLLTAINLLSNGSSTLQNFTGLNSTTTNATTTSMVTTTLCLTGDICRTTWPTSSGGGNSKFASSTDSSFVFPNTANVAVGIGALNALRGSNSLLGIFATTTTGNLIAASSTSGFAGNFFRLTNIAGTELFRIDSSGALQTTASTTLQNFTSVNSTTTNATSTIFNASSAITINTNSWLPNSPFQVGGSVNNYLQTGFQNRSNGSSASTDIAVTNDIGTDSTYYLNMGINSSGYSNSAYDIGTANDTYLYASDNSLTIGTASTSALANLIFHTGGTRAANERFRIANTGFAGFGTTTPKWALSIASSTAPQLTLTAGIADNHWTFRNAGGILYIATSSPSTYATSSASALSINANGFPTIPSLAGCSGASALQTSSVGAVNCGAVSSSGAPVYYATTTSVAMATTTIIFPSDILAKEYIKITVDTVQPYLVGTSPSMKFLFNNDYGLKHSYQNSTGDGASYNGNGTGQNVVYLMGVIASPNIFHWEFTFRNSTTTPKFVQYEGWYGATSTPSLTKYSGKIMYMRTAQATSTQFGSDDATGNSKFPQGTEIRIVGY